MQIIEVILNQLVLVDNSSLATYTIRSNMAQQRVQKYTLPSIQDTNTIIRILKCFLYKSIHPVKFQ